MLGVGVILAALPNTPFVGVDQMQLVWWFFAFGYVVAKYQKQLMPWRWHIAGGALAIYPLALYELTHNRLPEYLDVVKFTGVICCALLIYLAVRFLWAGRPLAYLGKRTLDIYVAQFVFTSLPLWNGYGRIAIVTIVAVAGSLGLAWLLRREPVLDLLFYGGRHTAASAAPRNVGDSQAMR
jgi:fucose 4-O-acetylase-like acetyltransferase